jgi:competence protein ComEA
VRRRVITEDAMKRLLCALAALLVSTAALAAVNLNTATKDELVALPGIGPSKAQAIIDYRGQNGPFRSVDEIRKVRGIGEKLFEQIKPELTIAASGGPRAAVAQGPARAESKSDAKPETRAPSRSGSGAIVREEKPRK